MKKFSKLITLLLILVLIASALIACEEPQDPNDPGITDKIDYVPQLKLDMNSSTAKLQSRGIEMLVDGDTTHFKVDPAVIKGGVLKARYAAIDTPESTGRIEQYGYKAKNFTNDKVSKAHSIMLESPTDKWETDTTGSRYMCWVWYKTSADAEWRNLNLEILQEGLAFASNTAGSLYGDICVNALNQARKLKLNVYSGIKDPDMYYGDALVVSLKDLRLYPDYYKGKTVSCEGIVSSNSGSNGVYIESYDEEDDMYYGTYLYYGFNSPSDVITNLSKGNLVRAVGTFQEYSGDFQIANLQYDVMDPDATTNTIVLEKGKQGAYKEVDAATFNSKKTMLVNDYDSKVEDADEIQTVSKEFDYAHLLLRTSVTIKNLKVVDVWTTVNEDSSSQGAMTLTCECDGETIIIRTIVLYEKDNPNKKVTAEYFLNKTFDFKGIVEVFEGNYQIKLLRLSDATLSEQ